MIFQTVVSEAVFKPIPETLMKNFSMTTITVITSLFLICTAHAADPLPSWNAGSSKSAILEFVQRTTTEGGNDFIPVKDRIAVFDNDGTLWCEQPAYFQLMFALERIKELAPQHPGWKETEPFKSVLAGELKGVAAQGEKGIAQIVAATHAGMTADEFNTIVRNWITTARHPKTGRLYSEMVYQPMLEVLSHLRANGYKTFIVSGGGVEFMRVFAEQTYGIPPEQVIGSSIKTKFELRDTEPVLVRLPDINSIDDGPGKPENIELHIGHRPVMAFGNSDGDLQMLQWTTLANGPRFGLIVHHTDAEREYAYDRHSSIGRLDKALDEAAQRDWIVVDMKKDWNQVFVDVAQ